MLLSSMRYGFLAMNLFNYDIIQWGVYIFGMLIMSHAISYAIYYLRNKFPQKLKEIEDKGLTFSS